MALVEAQSWGGDHTIGLETISLLIRPPGPSLLWQHGIGGGKCRCQFANFMGERHDWNQLDPCIFVQLPHVEEDHPWDDHSSPQDSQDSQESKG